MAPWLRSVRGTRATAFQRCLRRCTRIPSTTLVWSGDWLLLTQLLRNYQPAQTRPEFIRRDFHDASHTPSQLLHCYIFRVIGMWQVRGIVIDVTIIELLGVNAAH